MSNVNDVKADMEGKQANTGSHSRRTSERGSKANHDERSKKTQQTRHSGGGKDSRSNRPGNGGRDSTHSHKLDRYKRDASDHQSGRHGPKNTTRDNSGGSHVWSNHTNRSHRSNSSSGNDSTTQQPRGHKTNSAKNKPPLEGKDSGIGDNNSSNLPEERAKHKKDQPVDLSNSEIPAAVTNNSTIASDSGCTTASSLSSGSNGKESSDGLPLNESRNVYDRELLLAFRECTWCSITPAGFEQLPVELSRDILKVSHRRLSVDGTEETSEAKQEDVMNHASTIPSLNKDHHNSDQKNNTKVSLMPQRRSFGSGCSWRDNLIPKPAGGVDNLVLPKSEESGNDLTPPGSGGWSVVSHHGTHPSNHKVIDHVPYRSRHGAEWSQPAKSSNWRERNELNEDQEDEPEWMSFGPSDKYELMELKGIEEHEMEREARKDAKTKGKDAEQSSPDESPASSPLEKDNPKNELMDSGLPSSCPNDDEGGFMLDGFDFKSVLNIYDELASDSEDDEEHVDKDNLSKAKDPRELKNALISVLGISKEEQCSIVQDMSHAQMGSVVTSRPQVGRKALTLDQIEGQSGRIGSQDDDGDRSAFDKFFASMNTNTPRAQDLQQSSDVGSSEFGLTPNPIKAPPKPISMPLFTNQSGDSPPPFQDFSNMYQTPHSPPHSSLYSSQFRPNEPLPHHTPSAQQQPQHQPHQSNWSPGVWEGSEMHSKPSSSHLHPSPSSLGMHPYHLRQKPHSLGGMGVGGGPSSNSWVMEMEQMRISELNQLKYNQQQLQHYQQQQQQHERQSRMLHHQQMSSAPQKGGGSAPSLSFLPTSVMRHLHNSKPTQSINDIARTVSHPSSGRPEHDYLPQSPDPGMYSMHSSDSYYPSVHHQPPPGVSPSQHHHYPPQYHSSYRPNIRGAAMDMNYGFQPRPQVQSQYMRMGSSPVKPSLY